MPPPSEAPFEIVPDGPRLRSVAWPQVLFVVLAMLLGLLPLGLALILAV